MGEVDNGIDLSGANECRNLPIPRKHSECLLYKVEWFVKIIKNNKCKISLYYYLFLFLAIFFGFFWINNRGKSNVSYEESFKLEHEKTPRNTTYFPLICSPPNTTQKCPVNHYSTTFKQEMNPPNDHRTCPEYFKWISEDLKPWKSTGITKEMVEAGKGLVCFRLVVVNGKAYVEKYRDSYQTRDLVTIWGILQLVRLYQGRLPNLDLMFECDDKPVVLKANYKASNGSSIPPVFHYCSDDSSCDIVFPDWSFWGWPEINVKPWEKLMKDLDDANRRIKWEDRKPFAYWKGNFHIGPRMYLFGCNSTEKCGAQVYHQKWRLETRRRFRNSNLADQCTHRYKIYIEGKAWSVSEKYIQACDSMLLLVRPRYYEFFSRSLIPMKHYWPINDIRNMCKSIKKAVDWGNKNPEKAKEIGKEGSKFIFEDVKMRNVYDYMFHLLNEYGKLLRYKPTIPVGAEEVCSETIACLAQGRDKIAKMESFIRASSQTDPCTIKD